MNRIKDYKKLSEDIVFWIKNYADTNNIKSLVVGVSGGIDSAVVSTLCAMTGLPTWCTILPIHSLHEHTTLASTHCDWLCSQSNSVKRDIIDLSQVYDALFDIIPGRHHYTLSYVNTKSRLRMTTLYNIACTHQGIVVGTGNKIEDFGVFYFTKGGDGMVDISPIADLYKTEVRELGRYLGISQEIIDAVPTDGLWSDGRSDESVLQCTYEELEWAMEEYEHYQDHHNDVHYTTEQVRIMERYKELHTKGQHKILPIPIFRLN